MVSALRTDIDSILIIDGPFGSGKSVFRAGMIRALNTVPMNLNCRIFTTCVPYGIIQHDLNGVTTQSEHSVLNMFTNPTLIHRLRLPDRLSSYLNDPITALAEDMQAVDNHRGHYVFFDPEPDTDRT